MIVLDIGALILMGGKNSRMNGNVKGLLKLNNMTFLEKIKETLDDFSSIYLFIKKLDHWEVYIHLY